MIHREEMAGPLEAYMTLAIQEAETSLREGNHGFGAVIVRNNDVIACEHDTDETGNDPTAHAEMKAIQKASSVVGKDLGACTLVSTHEPCPMCAGAIVWARLGHLAYGFGIADAVAQGRRRIGIGCEEVFSRSNAVIKVEKDVRRSQCALLYDRRVRDEIRKLRGASDEALVRLNEDSKRKRLAWYLAGNPPSGGAGPLERAYELLVRKLGIESTEAPIMEKDGRRILFHSMNFCPTLEACKILRLDTRRVCKLSNEDATQELIRQVDPRLSFTRNYDRLRPCTAYCEEVIAFDE
jgi:tRNA(adenine34) deaminase